MIHIVIAGGSATMRGALAQIIGASSDILVDEEATLNTEAFERIRSRRVDLMLLDTTTSDLSGIRLIQQVHAEQPELPILVLSALNGAANVSRLLRAGASGYITSENRPDDLRVAVRQVASGERFIDPLLVDAIFFGTPADNGSQVGPLSNRENQVLGLIASGRSLSDIARSLALSVKTISTHKTRMMQKLNVGNNAELIRYAIRQGLVAE